MTPFPPLVEEEVVVRIGEGIEVRHLTDDDPLFRLLAVLDCGEQLGERYLPLFDYEIVDAGVLQDFMRGDRRVWTAYHHDDRRIHFLDHLDAFHDRVEIHAHHGETTDPWAPFDQLFAEMVPALQRAQVDEIDVEPFFFGHCREDGQSVADPAGIHALANAVKTFAGDAGVDQRNTHVLLKSPLLAHTPLRRFAA